MSTGALRSDLAIPLRTAALEAAWGVDATLRAAVTRRRGRTFIHVLTAATIRTQRVTGWTLADEAALGVATSMRTRGALRRALVKVDAGGAGDVHLVSAVAQAPI